MNLQTIENQTPQNAQNADASIVFYSANMAGNCDKSAIGGENTGRKTALSSDDLQTSNAQIIAELAHARCVFQLATICTIMGMTPPLERGQHLQEQTNDRT